MTVNNGKTILFAVLIAAMIIPVSGIVMTEAREDYSSKTDEYLFIKADNIEKKYKDGFDYNKVGNNKSGNSIDHKKHQDIVDELNSRGIFHRSQDQPSTMTPISISDGSVNQHEILDVFLIESKSIETNGSVCTDCEPRHGKMLSIKSGIEWNAPYFPWWEYRVEGDWSQWTNTFGNAVTHVDGDENDIRPYVMVTSNHPVTFADFQMGSTIRIIDQNGDLIPLTSVPVGQQYADVYFPYSTTEHKGFFPGVTYISAGSTHEVEIQISRIE